MTARMALLVAIVLLNALIPQYGTPFRPPRWVDAYRWRMQFFDVGYHPRRDIARFKISQMNGSITQHEVLAFVRSHPELARAGICFGWHEKAEIDGDWRGTECCQALRNWCVREDVDFFISIALGRDGPTHAWCVRSSRSPYDPRKIAWQSDETNEEY
jgi:hypothetical protein